MFGLHTAVYTIIWFLSANSRCGAESAMGSGVEFIACLVRCDELHVAVLNSWDETWPSVGIARWHCGYPENAVTGQEMSRQRLRRIRSRRETWSDLMNPSQGIVGDLGSVMGQGDSLVGLKCANAYHELSPMGKNQGIYGLRRSSGLGFRSRSFLTFRAAYFTSRTPFWPQVLEDISHILPVTEGFQRLL